MHSAYHDGMPVNITIRDVPTPVRDELAARAKRSGRSMQEYLVLQLGELARRPDPIEAIERARALAASVPAVGMDELLDDLHVDRR